VSAAVSVWRARIGAACVRVTSINNATEEKKSEKGRKNEIARRKNKG